ncbi:unnamed protein product, partial [Staurois parvus]
FEKLLFTSCSGGKTGSEKISKVRENLLKGCPRTNVLTGRFPLNFCSSDCLKILISDRFLSCGLTTHGAPGQQGIMGPLCPCPNSKKPMKKVPGASHGAPY